MIRRVRQALLSCQGESGGGLQDGSGRWRENLAGGGSVVLADEKLKAGAGPSQVFPHASGGVTLDQSGDAGGFQSGFGEVGFGTLSIGLHDDEIRVVHVF